jgi:hypothetical protein
MEVQFQKIEVLPRLAWCANVERRERRIRVLHGPHVETTDEFFCEGAWSGRFEDGDFEQSQFMGSGGKVTRRGLLIASPTHTIDRIYALQYGSVLSLSNSCAFVLAQAHDTLDPDYLLYSPKISSIIRGLDRYARWIPTRSGNRIHMFCHCNLHVSIDHDIEEQPKPPVRDFADFADYASFLEEQVTGIVRNANDPLRTVRYRPLATISSGYDSSASAVLARRAGCDEAVTFPVARFDGAAEKDDSGVTIGERLGMRVRVFNRLGYLRQTGWPEAEGGISEFLSLTDSLENRILVAGFNGDTLWDRSSDLVSRQIRRTSLSGDNLGELRLRIGFIHLPVPYLGCTSHPSVHRISNSSEMRPWRIRATYDKPIPRRLLEEAGVERGLFGAEKKAAAVVAREEGFERTMTKESLADFARFVRGHRSMRTLAKLRLYRGLYHLSKMHRAAKRRLERAASWLMRKPIWLPLLVPSDIERLGQSGPYALLYHWSIDKLLPRYQVVDGSVGEVVTVSHRGPPLLVAPE